MDHPVGEQAGLSAKFALKSENTATYGRKLSRIFEKLCPKPIFRQNSY